MTLLSLSLIPLLIAQAAPLPGPVEARAEECLMQASNDPVTAIATASEWLGEGATGGATHAQECLGHAYVRLLRWQAADEAFMAARDAAPPDDTHRRARLAAMAGNAALTEGRHIDALTALEAARGDAAGATDAELAAMIELDLARTQVALGRPDDAAAALAAARAAAPQNAEGWLLSATLARRQGELAEAQAFIETAGALAPSDPQVGLEAGVIAVLSGEVEAARASWLSVLELAPGGEAAQAASAYIGQLEGIETEARP